VYTCYYADESKLDVLAEGKNEGINCEGASFFLLLRGGTPLWE
jgi:hypothetical protein